MREIVFEVAREQVDAWTDALLGAGALAVQAEDADADSPDEQPLFGEPGHEPDALAWHRTRLAAMTDDAVEPRALLAEAAAAIDQAVPPTFALRKVADQDWVRATQAQFEPIPVGSRLLIAPSWHLQPSSGTAATHARVEDAPVEALHAARAGPEASPATARVAIEMDPGLAFGTGSHPTTRLCLEWLDAHLRQGARVIDYGCGSGILAIAAARLGAGHVVAIDIDPQALVAARDNARRNHVALDVRAARGAPPAPADVVLANILSNPLKLLAPMLASLVAPGGTLVLSGVLERQADEVAACYAPHLPVMVVDAREGWVCLAGVRQSSVRAAEAT